MTTRRRSLVHESDFRKLAKVAREENVIVRGRVAASGLDFTIEPAHAAPDTAADDFAARVDAFGSM